ncbi:pre-mRNA-splicing factor cwc22, partial [Ceratobasidium sp. 395]
MKVNIQEGQEIELCNMIVECCSQERSYSNFYGLIGERFCKLNRVWCESFEEAFATYFETIHRYETNRLRNIARFFGHLLANDGISWAVFSVVKVNEEDTTSSSRIFVKILMQELQESMGLKTMTERFKDPTMRESFAGMFPMDDPTGKSTRFSVNYFTALGLGVLTEGMRANLLENAQKMAAIRDLEAQRAAQEESSSSDSSDSDSSSDSSDTDSDSDSDDSRYARRSRRRSESRSRSPPRRRGSPGRRVHSSPPRRRQSTPPRRRRGSSPSVSRSRSPSTPPPPRRSGRDYSPPRKGDYSPPRRPRRDSPSPRRDDSPRRRYGSPPRRPARDDSPPPPRRSTRDDSPPRRTGRDDSPPRRSGRDDSPPPRRRAISPDTPPQRRGDSPRRRRESPPHRARDEPPCARETRGSPGPSRRGGRDSPPHRRYDDSPPRRRADSPPPRRDSPPPRRSSPPRRREDSPPARRRDGSADGANGRNRRMPPKRAKKTPAGAGAGGGAGGGGGGGGPAGGAGAASAAAPPSHVTTVGVKRPGYGKAGRPTAVLVNHFVCTIPTGTIYHYDEIGGDRALPARANVETMKMLQERLEPNLFSPKGAYDGRKNLFTTKQLALGDSDTRIFEMPMGNPRPDSDRPPRTRRIKIQSAQRINPEVLSQFQQGRHAQDNVVLTALMALNVALRHEPISKYTFNTRSFFLPAGKKPVPMGLELWPGVFQSIRPAVNSMHINIDTSTGVIYKPGPVVEHALAFLGRSQVADLSLRGRLGARDLRSLQSRLKSLRIAITYLDGKKPE